MSTLIILTFTLINASLLAAHVLVFAVGLYFHWEAAKERAKPKSARETVQ